MYGKVIGLIKGDTGGSDYSSWDFSLLGLQASRGLGEAYLQCFRKTRNLSLRVQVP